MDVCCVCFLFLILKTYFEDIDQFEEGRSIFASVLASMRELAKVHPDDEEKLTRVISIAREGFQCVCDKVIFDVQTDTVCMCVCVIWRWGEIDMFVKYSRTK